jgi:hypothetical protein
MTMSHDFIDDGSGITCEQCGLPKSHARHPAERTGLKPVAHLGVNLTPNQHGNSQRAALAEAWPKAGTARSLVLAYVVDRGSHGATDDELAAANLTSANGVRPRRGELVEHGWLRPATDHTDQPETRPTRSGHDAQVWVATAAALEQLRRDTA